MPLSGRSDKVDGELLLNITKVALGEKEADLAIVNGTVVNVYTGEILPGQTVLVSGDRIAYVGGNAGKSIGNSTRVIDASGKVLIPGLIDGHTHLVGSVFSASEFIKYAMTGGTTTIITETGEIAFALGYRGIKEYLRSVKNQPIKIFITVPPMVAMSPVAKERPVDFNELRKLLKRREVIGLGELYWAAAVNGDEKLFNVIAEVVAAGKTLDGHSAGARDNKLQAYTCLGISSCHESTTAEEVLERSRLGVYVLLREGEIRRELEAASTIKDENIDFRRLAVATDGVGPEQLINDGYMEFVVQKAINLGFNPVLAIQMATINVARRFNLDDIVGGIAPGKYADIVVIPDLSNIRAEYVISNGQVIAQDGQPLVQPRKHTYPRSMHNSIRLPVDFVADDFAVRVTDGCRQVRVRAIDMVTGLLSREAFVDMPVLDGLVPMDTGKDLLKIAAIERTCQSGQTFVGFIRGIGLKQGAIATSYAGDSWDILVVGASEVDMALAVNRIAELGGGIIVCAGGKILAEQSLPIGGIMSAEPMEILVERLNNIQRAAAGLGCKLPEVRITLTFLTSGAIPFLRICEQGLIDVRQNRIVDLITDRV